jgi:copper/silver efflux system protein
MNAKMPVIMIGLTVLAIIVWPARKFGTEFMPLLYMPTPRLAKTATDPAPSEMFETVVNLKPKEEWRAGLTERI